MVEVLVVDGVVGEAVDGVVGEAVDDVVGEAVDDVEGETVDGVVGLAVVGDGDALDDAVLAVGVEVVIGESGLELEEPPCD